MHRPPRAIAAAGTVPGCFSPAMVAGLIRALPGPAATDGAELGRQTLHEALAMVRLYRPCDVIEAHLVQQIVILHYCALLAAALAAAIRDTPEIAVRYERHMMAQLRCAGALERRLRIYRRELAAQGYAPATDVAWDYDPAEMEALWREAHAPQAAGAPAAATGAPAAAAPRVAQPARGVARPERPAGGARQGDAPGRDAADEPAEPVGRGVGVAAAVGETAGGTRLGVPGAARPEAGQGAGAPSGRQGERTRAADGTMPRAA